jgi:hypothetical protein
VPATHALRGRMRVAGLPRAEPPAPVAAQAPAAQPQSEEIAKALEAHGLGDRCCS